MVVENSVLYGKTGTATPAAQRRSFAGGCGTTLADTAQGVHHNFSSQSP